MTVRPDHILHDLPVNEWTEEEGFRHLEKTFEIACRDFPDVMEQYAVRAADITDRSELKALFREALRETLHRRSYFQRIPKLKDTAA